MSPHRQDTRRGAHLGEFGHILRQHRRSAGLGLRPFAARVSYEYGYIAQVERGEKRGSPEFAAACDRVLDTGGALLAAYERDQGGTEMRRRTALRAMGAIVAAPVVPEAGLEAVRHGLDAVVDADHDEWPGIVADCGLGYYRQPHDVLMRQLGTDLAVLQHLIAVESDARRPRLLAAAGHLSVVVALGLVASGQSLVARRWWRSAQRVADESGDLDAILTTRAWHVVNGCYDGRPAEQVVALSDEVLPLLDGARVSAASCGLLAGRAQALSLAGRHAEAVACVRQLDDLAHRLPDAIVDNVESLWGWPEHRLRHTQSWVYTHAGDLRAAEAAQDRALQLYPQSQARLRAQVGLHRAAALIRGGHLPDGLRLAAELLDGLPPEQHNATLRSVARRVAEAVPVSQRHRPAYGELIARVAG
ncbi:helix-turn-helix domain-containing protein [Micromonospora sp. DT233]|uniref:helix-turn-helix domain-containing protein n=1 Tax=Micromonospora sp. DT233 TaxID=3393432 RepID=UPI003CF444CC